jgi:hypothetical protein
MQLYVTGSAFHPRRSAAVIATSVRLALSLAM